MILIVVQLFLEKYADTSLILFPRKSLFLFLCCLSGEKLVILSALLSPLHFSSSSVVSRLVLLVWGGLDLQLQRGLRHSTAPSATILDLLNRTQTIDTTRVSLNWPTTLRFS